MKKPIIAVIFGGRSVEHEISVISGLQLIEALDVVAYDPLPVYIAPSGKWYTGEALLNRKFYTNMPASLSQVQEVVLLPVPNIGGLTVLAPHADNGVIPVDVYFPVFHGSYGEDGCVQGLFEMADVTYACSDVISSAISMSKYHCKKLVESHGIPVLPCELIERQEIEQGFGSRLPQIRQRVFSNSHLSQFPLFLKPNNLGSSIAVAKVDHSAAFDAALVTIFKYDVTAIVEPCVNKKMEINVSVMEGFEPLASVVEIPLAAAGGELTYEDKYLREGGKKNAPQSQGMAGLTRVIDPQDLDSEMKALAQKYAVQAFKAIGCSGVARVDFMVDLENNRLYFNEINPIPGSMSFYLWMNSHPPVLYTELITRLIQNAQTRANRKAALSREIAFQALLK